MSMELLYFFLLLALSVTTGTHSTTCSKTVSATSQEAFTHPAVLYLFPQASDQAYAVNTCAASAKQIFNDNSFQLHEPDTKSHGDDAFPVEDAERVFEEKWTNFMKKKQAYKDGKLDSLVLDPFFDHNFAMYVTDLTQNLDVIQNQENSGLDVEVPYIISKWSLKTPVDNKNDFISLILHLPNTQIVYELITEYDETTLGDYLENEVIINVEQRASFIGLEYNDDLPWDSTEEVIPLRQGRAVSNIEINVLWYETYLNAIQVESGIENINGQSIEYTYIILPFSSNFTIGFFKRDNINDNLITITDFENGINTVHKELVISPNCQYDRWFDNHYAMGYVYTGLTDGLFCNLWNKVVYESSQRYIVFKFLKEDADDSSVAMFEQYGFDYVWFLNLIEPNGNTIEVIGYCDDEKMKATANPFDGYFCNLCSDSEIHFDNSKWKDNGDEFRKKLKQTKKTQKLKQGKIHKTFSSGNTVVFYSSIGILIILLGLIKFYYGSNKKVTMLQNQNVRVNYGSV